MSRNLYEPTKEDLERVSLRYRMALLDIAMGGNRMNQKAYWDIARDALGLAPETPTTKPGSYKRARGILREDK
jgi:hypothetical protein